MYFQLWELPEVFRTDLGKCNWLFFKTPPSAYKHAYKQIRLTRIKWKLNRRSELQLLGHDYECVIITAMSLTFQPGTENVNAQEEIYLVLLR